MDCVADGKLAVAVEEGLGAGAVHILHDEEERAAFVVAAEAVPADDVGVVEPGRVLGLALEALDEGGVGRTVGGEDFDRILPVGRLVVGEVDRAHPALAELAEHAVRADGLQRVGSRRVRGAGPHAGRRRRRRRGVELGLLERFTELVRLRGGQDAFTDEPVDEVAPVSRLERGPVDLADARGVGAESENGQPGRALVQLGRHASLVSRGHPPAGWSPRVEKGGYFTVPRPGGEGNHVCGNLGVRAGADRPFARPRRSTWTACPCAAGVRLERLTCGPRAITGPRHLIRGEHFAPAPPARRTAARTGFAAVL